MKVRNSQEVFHLVRAFSLDRVSHWLYGSSAEFDIRVNGRAAVGAEGDGSIGEAHKRVCVGAHVAQLPIQRKEINC
jgi:hypothetical protein